MEYPRSFNAVELLRQLSPRASDEEPVEGLVRLIDGLRPSSPEDAEPRVHAICMVLRSDEPARRELARRLCSLPARVSCVRALTESGIPNDHGFFEELLLRFTRKLLPEVEDPSDLRVLVRRLFHCRDDHVWLRAVREETWRELFELLGFGGPAVAGVPAELQAAVRILAAHVASLGLAPEITHRLPELDHLDSPFLRLQEEVRVYSLCFDDGIQGDEGELLETALTTLSRCRDAVLRLRGSKQLFGTSLRLTTLSFRLLRQIDRLETLLHLTDPIRRDGQAALLRLFLDLVEDEHAKNSLRRHLREGGDLLAYQVVEHAAQKGSHYITSTAPEFWAFFRASLGGGVFVACFALGKLLLSHVQVAPAMEALLLSLNYSLCFVLLHLTGAALATKQPALTAHTIAQSMDGPGGVHRLDALVELVVRASRSQFISFVGNLLAALPLGFGLAWVLSAADTPPAGPEKASYLLAENHPWYSASLLYAGIAGIYLFVSGLISGYFDNRNLYRRISLRIGHHPWLRRLLGEGGAARVARLVEKQGGAVLGNIFLGCCLGSTRVFGQVFGLPFDIRHIAFSSANVGMGLALSPHLPGPALLAQLGLGVALIGLVNFLVSFWLAMGMAVESRRLTIREYRAVLILLIGRAARRPWEFFLPGR